MPTTDTNTGEIAAIPAGWTVHRRRLESHELVITADSGREYRWAGYVRVNVYEGGDPVSTFAIDDYETPPGFVEIIEACQRFEESPIDDR